MIRVLLLLPFLVALGWWLNLEHHQGRFQRVDEVFLDFLVANTRARFENPQPDPAASPVVLIKMRAADRAEYVGWPPRPLDWQMVLKGLQAYAPAVIVIPETLMWGRPSPEFVTEAAAALRPFPSTILGVEAMLSVSPSAPAFLGGLEDVLPRFQKVQGEVSLAPSLGSLVAAPDDQLRRQGELGIAISHQVQGSTFLPYALQEQGNFRPSVLAQALSRISSTPYANQRLLIGAGGGAYLADGTFVPLSNKAEYEVDTSVTVPEVDALNLMTVELADALTPQDKQNLGQGKIVVLGTDDEAAEGGLARLHAQALTRILSAPRIHLLSPLAEWCAWAGAGLLGCLLVLWVPRTQAFSRGLLLVFLALVFCFVAFQASLLWCPPTLPVALLVASTLFARLFGRKPLVESVLPAATAVTP